MRKYEEDNKIQKEYNKRRNRIISRASWKEYVNTSAYKLLPNEPRWNSHNTIKHELAKAKIGLMLKKEKVVCYCELILKNHSGRPDVFIPSMGVVIEVLESETKKKFKEKLDKYPEAWTIISFEAYDVLREDFVLEI